MHPGVIHKWQQMMKPDNLWNLGSNPRKILGFNPEFQTAIFWFTLTGPFSSFRAYNSSHFNMKSIDLLPQKKKKGKIAGTHFL